MGIAVEMKLMTSSKYIRSGVHPNKRLSCVCEVMLIPPPPLLFGCVTQAAKLSAKKPAKKKSPKKPASALPVTPVTGSVSLFQPITERTPRKESPIMSISPAAKKSKKKPAKSVADIAAQSGGCNPSMLPNLVLMMVVCWWVCWSHWRC